MEYKHCAKCDSNLPATREYFFFGRGKPQHPCKKCQTEQRQKTKDIKKAYDRKRYEEKRSQILEQNAEYKRANKELNYELAKQWRDENPDKTAEYRNKYQSKLKENGADFKTHEWRRCLEHFDHSCAYCGMTEDEHKKVFSTKLNKEHIVPVSKGGKFTAANIIPACMSCNAKKRDRDFTEWYPSSDVYSAERENRILAYIQGASNQDDSFFHTQKLG